MPHYSEQTLNLRTGWWAAGWKQAVVEPDAARTAHSRALAPSLVSRSLLRRQAAAPAELDLRARAGR